MFSTNNLPKNFFSEVKNNFIKFNFWHNSKTEKDILKIPTDLSSAGQQLNNSKDVWKLVDK